MKPFIASFGQCGAQLKRSKEETTDYHSILISLYKEIYEANETIFKAGCFQSKLVDLSGEIKEEVLQPESKDSRYFPRHIQNYISAKETSQLIFTCQNVGQREITIVFTLFDNKIKEYKIKQYTEYVRLMYIWLHICSKYADPACTETLRVFIYPTPFLKKMPASTATVIGPEHINTAFTRACAKKGQIIIFREEEWFKVFLHETFHSYGLDFAVTDHQPVSAALRKLFPLSINFNSYEAYTETWARIINCVFCSFNAMKQKKAQKEFLTNLTFCLEIERMFAIYQCLKIAGFMGLHYADLHSASKAKHLYKENTHVFAYYILSAIFLNDAAGFMLWCKKHNTNLFKFKATNESFKQFGAYIASQYNCISLLNGMTQMGALNTKVNQSKNTELKDTTRMSLIHLYI